MRWADYRTHKQTRKRINLRDGGELPQFYLMRLRMIERKYFAGWRII